MRSLLEKMKGLGLQLLLAWIQIVIPALEVGRVEPQWKKRITWTLL